MPTPRSQELGSDLIGRGLCHRDDHGLGQDPRIADEKLRLVEKVIQGRDFTCMVETVNAVEAWLGLLPGHVYANVRQPPVSTLNLAHMIPLSAVWAGPARDEHFEAPPLFFARTEGSTPFRFSLHVGDVGHTLVVGPTGAGKSVLLALMALQFRRYRQLAGLRLRLRRLDPGRGARHGRRLARSRRRAVRRRLRAGCPAAARQRSTMRPSAAGRRNGSPPSSPAKRSTSRRKPRSIFGRR